MPELLIQVSEGVECHRCLHKKEREKKPLPHTRFVAAVEAISWSAGLGRGSNVLPVWLYVINYHIGASVIWLEPRL